MDMPTYLYEYMDALKQIERLSRAGETPQDIADYLNRSRSWTPEEATQWTPELVKEYYPMEERKMNTQAIIRIIEVGAPILVSLVILILKETSGQSEAKPMSR